MKCVISFLLVLFFVASAAAENIISMGNIELEEGQSVIAPINTTDTPMLYGQACIEYDASVVELSAGGCDDYGFVVSVSEENSELVRMYTGSDANCSPGEREFGSVAIKAVGYHGDVSRLNLLDAVVRDEQGTPMVYGLVGGWVTITPLFGDVNRDMMVDVRDAIVLVNHVSCPYCSPIPDFHVADMNRDGMISMLDVLMIINRCVSTA